MYSYAQFHPAILFILEGHAKTIYIPLIYCWGPCQSHHHIPFIFDGYAKTISHLLRGLHQNHVALSYLYFWGLRQNHRFPFIFEVYAQFLSLNVEMPILKVNMVEICHLHKNVCFTGIVYIYIHMYIYIYLYLYIYIYWWASLRPPHHRHHRQN